MASQKWMAWMLGLAQFSIMATCSTPRFWWQYYLADSCIQCDFCCLSLEQGSNSQTPPFFNCFSKGLGSQPLCPLNQTHDKCASPCGQTCYSAVMGRPVACTDPCKPGCRCKDNYYKHGDRCLRLSDCKSRRTWLSTFHLVFNSVQKYCWSLAYTLSLSTKTWTTFAHISSESRIFFRIVNSNKAMTQVL